MTLTHTEPVPAVEEIWRLFRENAEQMREIAHRFQETDRKFQETAAQFRETDRKFQETDREIQETGRIMRASSQETAAQIRETSQKVKELDKLFTSQWGRLMESLVEGALVRIFNDWGLPVRQTAIRVHGSYQGQSYEFDIIVRNGEAVVITEVKTTLRPKDVMRFLKKLDHSKVWLSEYTGNRIHGAMAFLQADAGAESMVVNRGLFAIRAAGDSAYLVNPPGFEPRTW